MQQGMISNNVIAFVYRAFIVCCIILLKNVPLVHLEKLTQADCSGLYIL